MAEGIKLKHLILSIVLICFLAALVSLFKGDFRSTATFLVLAIMSLVIYQAILPGPTSWKTAIMVLIILAVVLMALIAPAALDTFLKKLPFIS